MKGYKLLLTTLIGLTLGLIIGELYPCLFQHKTQTTYDYWIYAPDEQRNWNLNDWRTFIPAPIRFLIPYHGDVLVVTGIYGGIYSLNKGNWLFKYDRWFDPWSYVYVAGKGLDRVLLAGFDTPYILMYDGNRFTWIKTPTEPVKITRCYGWAENTTDEDLYFFGGDGYIYRFNARTLTIEKRAFILPSPWVGFGAVGRGGKCYFPEGHPPEQGGGIYEYDPERNYVKKVYNGSILGLTEFAGGYIALEQSLGGRQVKLVWTPDFRTYKVFLLPESINFMRGVNEFGITPYKFHLYDGMILLYVRGIVYTIGYFPAYPVPWKQPSIAPLFGSPLQIADMTFYKGKIAIAFSGNYAGDRYYSIIALSDPSTLFRCTPPPAYATIWYNESLDANILSIPVIVNGWNKKTLLFMSNVNGTLTIEVAIDGGNWIPYKTLDIEANKPLYYTFTDSISLMRLKFNANTNASSIVTAIVHLQP